ncbi:heparinase II/III domain-containing protein [Natronococcus wangiae]|uniref:heparinase II/III domain-containing protein n=1 Tax=Natronococcus wangiae TaxID=3068275 RepID=UPI0027401812|nr:heparinase II/III family protein [Natronococcus sp. AD5]
MSRNEWSGKRSDRYDEQSAVTDRAIDVEVSRRSLLAATGGGILAGLTAGAGTASADSDAFNAKSRLTLWTEEMRENARRNVERYDWAATERDSAVGSADEYLEEHTLDDLWHMVTSQKIPRGGGTTHFRQLMGWSWTGVGIDRALDRPWKMRTATEEYVVPTNDFAAYRESGLDDRGMFDPALADDQYLVNEEHPEMGEGWGVDDGTGWIDEDGDIGDEGQRMNFAAYYNHWYVWRPGGILRIVEALADAYLLTGDRKYSRAGTVLLDRIADVYPEMTIYDYPDPEYWNSTGGRGTGKVIGATWESNLMRPIIQAYDAFFPGMDGDDELIAFLDAKTDEYPGLEGKDSVEKIRKNIEDGILREVLPAAENSDIILESGGYSALAQSARVLDEPDGYTREAIEWIFQPGKEKFVGDQWDEEPENWITTGGNILAPLVDVVDRDGYNNRGSPMYNRIRQTSFREAADHLQGYDGFDGADLYQHPKFRQTLRQNTHLLLLDRYVPEIGNAHPNRNADYLSTSSIEAGYQATGRDIFAQLWHFVNGYSTVGIRGSIFDADPEGVADEIRAVIDAEGPLDLPSQNLAGYGFAALRDGTNYLNRSFGTIYDTSELFAEASTDVNDSFDEAIQLQAYEEGEWWEFEFEADASDEYDLEIETLFVSTYGIYDLYINGERIDTVDFYSPSFDRDTITYTVELPEGTNTMRWENVGKNEESDNYLMALYYLTLIDESERENREAASELGNAKRAFWLYYGRNDITYHNHSDTLNVGVAAHELELSPDLGYVEATGDWPKGHNWTMNTVSHNTVVVDEEEQHTQWVSTPRHFDGADDRVNLVDVEAPHVYPQADEYRRTLATVAVDEEHSYAVDFFRVAGGDDHHFSFHGAKGEASADGVDLVPQDGGTYAGEDVPKPGYGEDTEYNREVGNGFNYLDNVERDADPGRTVAIDWDVEDHWNRRDDDADGVHVRLTTFGEFDEVALADGHPPQHSGNPETLRYALAHRSGADLKSTFVSTIEHYDGDRVVESVEEVDAIGGDARAVKVELTTGRTDYVVCTFGEVSTVTVDETFSFRGFFGLYSVEDGEPEYAYVHDGTLLKPLDRSPLVRESAGYVRGFVEDFTRGMRLENELELRIPDDKDEIDRNAGFVYVDNDDSDPWRGRPDLQIPAISEPRGRGNGAYPIENFEVGGGNTVTVDVGERTFVRQFDDPDELEDGGYEYIIERNNDVRIPLTATWSRE